MVKEVNGDVITIVPSTVGKIVPDGTPEEDRQRSVDGLTLHHGGRGLLDRQVVRSGDRERAAGVDGIAECVHDAAEQRGSRRHGDDPAGGLHLVAFLHLGGVAEEHATDVVLLQVEGHATDAAGEFEQLVHHAVVQPPHAGDAVAHREYGADALHGALALVAGDLLFQDHDVFPGPSLHGRDETDGRMKMPVVVAFDELLDPFPGELQAVKYFRKRGQIFQRTKQGLGKGVVVADSRTRKRGLDYQPLQNRHELRR